MKIISCKSCLIIFLLLIKIDVLANEVEYQYLINRFESTCKDSFNSNLADSMINFKTFGLLNDSIIKNKNVDDIIKIFLKKYKLSRIIIVLEGRKMDDRILAVNFIFKIDKKYDVDINFCLDNHHYKLLDENNAMFDCLMHGLTINKKNKLCRKIFENNLKMIKKLIPQSVFDILIQKDLKRNKKRR